MKTVIKIIGMFGLLGMLTACATQPVVNQKAAQQAQEKGRQDYLEQVLKNKGGDIQRHGNHLLVFLPVEHLFAPGTTAFLRSTGVPMLTYTTKILSDFNMAQMTVAIYSDQDLALAKARAKMVQDYLWDAHINGQFTFTKIHQVDPRSNEVPRIELQIQLAK